MSGLLPDLMSSAKIFLGLLVAVEEGLPDLLDETVPTPAEKIVAAMEAEPGPTRSLLRALGNAGLVAECEEGWTLTAAGARLRLSHPHTISHYLRLESWGMRAHLTVPGIRAALRGARNRTELPDDLVPVLASAMRVGASLPALLVSRLPEMRAARRLVDVCAGPGRYAIALCRANRDLRATLLEREPMLASTRQLLADQDDGIAARIEPIEWDLHHSPIPVSADAALVSHVMHLLRAPERLNLLTRIAAQMPSGGVLVVHDYLGPGVDGGVLVDWLALGTGFDLTADEMTAEIESCGFGESRTVRVGEAGTTLVVSRRREPRRS